MELGHWVLNDRCLREDLDVIQVSGHETGRAKVRLEAFKFGANAEGEEERQGDRLA